MLSADKPQLWLTRSTSSKRHRIDRAAMEAKSGASFAETVKRLTYPWGRLTKGDDSGRGEAVDIEADGAKIGHSFIARQTLRLRKSFDSKQTEQRQAQLF